MRKLVPISIVYTVLVIYVFVFLTNAVWSSFWALVGSMAVVLSVPSLILALTYKNNAKPFYLAQSTAALRYYTRMQLMISVSVYLNIWIFFMRYFRNEDYASTLWLPLIAIFASGVLVTICSAVSYRFARTRWVKRSVFVVGALLCLSAYLFGELSVVRVYAIYYALYSCGIGLMFTSLAMFSVEVKQTIMLTDVEEDKTLDTLYIATDMKAQLIAHLTFYTVLMLFYKVLQSSWLTYLVLASLSAASIIAAIVLSVAFPIDKQYAHKLEQYYTNDVNVNKELLEKQLKGKLYNGNNSITLSFLRSIVRPFFPAKVIGKHNVNLKDGAVIFVANHYEIYGPLVTVLRLPFHFRPWIISSMLDNKLVEKQLESGVDTVCHVLPKKMRTRLRKMIHPLIIKVLTALDPIPVHRGNTREVLTTLKITVEALQQGDNILLFPEKDYSQEGDVEQFYTGFAEIGVRYWRATGKCTTFYPVYVDKQAKQIVIGKGVQYTPTEDNKIEKQRIASQLNESMQLMRREQSEKWEQKQRKRAKNKKKKDAVVEQQCADNTQTAQSDKTDDNTTEQ